MQRRLTLALLALSLTAPACKKEPPPAPPAPPPPPPAQVNEPPDPNGVKPPPDVAEVAPDAKTLPSGLASKVLRDGSGGLEHPGPEDSVKIHYTGWTTAGRTIRTTIHGEPEQFQLNKAIKGWVEGIQLMRVGEKRRFWIPLALANAAAAPKESKMQVWDIELLAIDKAQALPTGELAPAADAQKTKSGLMYKVLKKGKGKAHPKPENTVEVHYTGWTRDGKEYDSTIKRGKPAKIPATGPFPGWAEAMSLLVVGEKARFWFPSNLALGDHPATNAPGGMMVFDIELLAIE